jgi:hypothetical protein
MTLDPGLGELDSVAIAIAGWVLSTSMQLLALGVMAALLERLFGRFGTAVRAAAWWVVLVRAAMPPLFTLPLGADLREIACDRRVVFALGGHAAVYRRTLLRLAHALSDRPVDPALALIDRRSQILARLGELERPVTCRAVWEPVVASLLFAGLLACAAPATRLTPATPAAPSPPDLDRLPGSLQKRYAVLQWMATHEP